MKPTETRCYDGQEFRAVDSDNEKIIEGHAAVFDQKTNICGCFYEVIDRVAFDDTSLRDVPLFVNHDVTQIPLARSRRNNGNSSMTLTVDEKGLAIRARLDVEGVDATAVFTGANATLAGKRGIVPAALVGNRSQFLRGDGVWATPTNTTYGLVTTYSNGLMSTDDKVKLDCLSSTAEAIGTVPGTAEGSIWFEV